MKPMSKNAISIDQLKLACRHVEEMRAAGISENLAIRSLELFADVYAKLHGGGRAAPHHVSHVSDDMWSKNARALRKALPDARPRDHYRVEHGTPRREFARAILKLYQGGKLTERRMNGLVRKHWRLAVLTLDECRKLDKIARSKMYPSPAERWAAAGIKF
jgi:hypothetical protein